MGCYRNGIPAKGTIFAQVLVRRGDDQKSRCQRGLLYVWPTDNVLIQEVFENFWFFEAKENILCRLESMKSAFCGTKA